MKTLERGRTKKSLLDEIWSKRAIYLLISPFFLFYAVFGLYPIVYSLILSFHKWSGSGEMQYIGLLNYQVLLKDPNFSRAVLNTLSIWCLNTIPMVIMALIIAFLLNLASLKFKAFFRAVYFLPNITSTVAVSIVFSTLFANNYGLVNFALTSLGLGTVSWMSSTFWIQFVIALVVTWRWTGYNAIIALAGLHVVDIRAVEVRDDGLDPFQLLRLACVDRLDVGHCEGTSENVEDIRSFLYPVLYEDLLAAYQCTSVDLVHRLADVLEVLAERR